MNPYINFAYSQAFETVAFMHMVTYQHNNNLFNFKSVDIKSELKEDILELGSLTYDWILVLDMVTTFDLVDGIPCSIDIVMKKLSDLPAEKFLQFLIGEHKLSEKKAKQILTIPELALDYARLFPYYVDINAFYDLVNSFDETRRKIQELILRVWREVLQSEWLNIYSQINSECIVLKHQCKQDPNVLFNCLNENLSYQDGRVVYTNVNEYPVFNFPFHKEIRRINVYLSQYLSSHRYMNTVEDRLNMGFAVSNYTLFKGIQEIDDLVGNLKIISDSVRLSILVITKHQPMTTNQMASHFRMSTGNISKHLKILSETGLITKVRHKREVYYQANEEKLRTIIGRLITVTRHTDISNDSLVSLKSIAPGNSDHQFLVS